MSSQGPSEAVVQGLSGSLGSVLALLATYPLKTIYTLQALSTSSGAPAPASAPPDAQASQLLATLRFLQQYKLSTLYAGLGPNVVEAGLSTGVYFYFYSMFRNWARDRATPGPDGRRTVGVLASLLTGAAAGAANQLLTMPVSVVATRMQGYQSLAGASGSRRPPTTWETISSVFGEDGIGGFWKGMIPSMVLLVNPAVQYMLYEKLVALLLTWKAQRAARAAAAAAEEEADDIATATELLSRRRSADSDEALDGCKAERVAAKAAARKAAGGPVTLSAGEVFLAGALAKIGATVVTYPLIVVKARMQASSKATGSSSTWGVITETARKEGAGGFFKGLRAKILQTALNAALMLMLKEQLHSVAVAALAGPKLGPKVEAAAKKPEPAAAG